VKLLCASESKQLSRRFRRLLCGVGVSLGLGLVGLTMGFIGQAPSASGDALAMATWGVNSGAALFMLSLGLVALAAVVRALQRMQLALANSEALYRQLFEDTPDGVLVLDSAACVRGLNPAALELTGRSQAGEVIGRALSEFFPHPIDPATGQPSALPAQRLQRALAGEPQRFEYSFEAARTQQRTDCEMRLSSFTLDGVIHLLCRVRDLSDEHRLNRQQESLAHHDPLTGLPDQHSLLRCLDERIESQAGDRFELVFVNLARFKEINDAFGHRAANMVLEIMARRLERQLLALGWSLARAGSSDFVAVPPVPKGTAASGSTQAVCELMEQVSREPITLGDHRVVLPLKLGRASYPADALDAGQLLRRAKVAATRTRTPSGSELHNSRGFDSPPGHDLKMRSELSAAIRSGQLQLAWQPKLWLESREIEGVEALLRWHHPRLGWIAPSEFIPLAESTGLIYPLTRWMISAALTRWRAGRPRTGH